MNFNTLLHHCMQCIVLSHIHVAAEESRAVQCAIQVTRVPIESFCLTESSTVQDFFGLAHGSCSWPTRWTIDQAVSLS